MDINAVNPARAHNEANSKLGLVASTPNTPAPNFERLALELCWSVPASEVIDWFLRQAELLRLDFAEVADRPHGESEGHAADAIRRRALEHCRGHPASVVHDSMRGTAQALSNLVGLPDPLSYDMEPRP